MQLDKTQIAIRERTIADTMDLSLHVARVYFPYLALTFALGAVPLAIINELLIGWTVSASAELAGAEAAGFGEARYFWLMAMLVYLEGPLASVFATTFLGHAVFMERPGLGTVVRDVLRVWPHVLWYLGLWRGVLPAWLLVAAMDREGSFSVVEGLLLLSLLPVWLWRSRRSFLSEIVLLERNPMRARDSSQMTIGRRSTLLHNPRSGDLMYRGLVVSMCASVLALVMFGAVPTLQQVLLDTAVAGALTLRLGWPLVLWTVTGLCTVIRFLNYLDLRIRHEGWEVELRVRAEGARLAGRSGSERLELSRG